MADTITLKRKLDDMISKPTTPVYKIMKLVDSNEQCVKYIINRNGLSIINSSIRRKSPKLINKFLDLGYNPNMHDSYGRTCGLTALKYFKGKRLLDLFQTLIDHGYNLNTCDLRYSSILHEALLTNHYDLVEVLINQGVNVNAQNLFGTSPLHYAISKGYHKIVKLLLERGAEVDIINNFGDTPLTYVSHKNTRCATIVRYLMDHGLRISKYPEQIQYINKEHNHEIWQCVLDIIKQRLSKIRAKWIIETFIAKYIVYKPGSAYLRRLEREFQND
jgi:ankyrin repeat protein